MNMTVLPGKKSYEAVFRYNYDKCLAGKAQIEFCGNIPGQNPVFPRRLPIQDAFLKYIENPAVSERLRKEVLHLSFSPGPDDSCTHEQVVKAIGETLGGAGYGDNPYVIFRHNDIEREHFHVMTPTVNAAGKCIEKLTNKNVMFLMLSTLKKIGPKYGFVLGESEEAKRRKLSLGLGSEPSEGVAASMKRAFEEALEFDFDTDFQFRCLLDLHNLIIKKSRNRTTGKEYLLLQKCNRRREPVSKPISLNKLYGGEDCLARYCSRLAGNVEARKNTVRDNGYIRRVIEECRKVSYTLADFRQALYDCGIRTTPTWDTDGRRMKKMSVIDLEHKIVYNYVNIDKGYNISDLNYSQVRQRPARVPMFSVEQANAIKRKALGIPERETQSVYKPKFR